MKIYKFKEFLKLPPGTFFIEDITTSESSRIRYTPFCLKEETITDDEGKNVDFWYIDLSTIESEGDQDFFNKLTKMEKYGVSEILNTAPMRDATYEYDNNTSYFVYEPEDLKIIKSYIDDFLNKEPKNE